MQAGYRHIQLVGVGIFQRQEFGGAFAEVHAQQTEVAADAVGLVHYRITDLDLGQVAQHAFGGGALGVARGALAHLRGIEFVFSDERDLRHGINETVAERRHAEHEVFAAGVELRPVRDLRRLQPVFSEILEHGFSAAQRLGEYQDASGVAVGKAAQPVQRIVGAALDMQWRQRGCRGIE